jgi:hypothetical protein
MKIEKSYFTLGEIRERWCMTEADIAYLAENGELPVSVRVCRLPVEIASLEETAEGERFSVPHTHTRFSGVLDLYADDAFRVFQERSAIVSDFLAPDGDYVSVLPDCEAVEVRQDKLLVRTQERDRFETQSRSAGPTMGVAASDDYRKVWVDGELVQLGRIQAEVVRALHTAQRARDPWQSGKEILTAAGSKSLRMADVFKSKPAWRRLIHSNRCGFYRLAVALRPK